MQCTQCSKEVDAGKYRQGLCPACYMRKRRAEQAEQQAKADLHNTGNTPAEPEAPRASGVNALTDAIAAVVRDAIGDQRIPDDLAARLDAIEDRVTEIANRAPREIHVNVNGVTHKIDGRVHFRFDRILAYVGARRNVCLVGPSGSGKTHLCEQIAKSLGLDYYYTGAIMDQWKLLGYQDANGRYIRTPFREAYENGGLFLLDELDGSDPVALVAFNAALENGWAVFPDGMVKRHPDFVCIAAGNTYMGGSDRLFVGRNQLDFATKNRFAYVAMPYDETLESAIVEDMCDGHEHGPQALAWLRRVQGLRAALMKTDGIRFAITPRASFGGARMILAGLPMDDELESEYIWQGLETATRQKIEANYIASEAA
jgi:hypothetical protein